MPYFACDEDYLSNNYTAFFLSFNKPLSLDDIMSIDGNTVNVNINGPLYESKYKLIYDALLLADDTQIKNVNLQVNSPGGAVTSYLDRIWQQVFSLRSNGKNVVAYNNGMMASAAYWISSAAIKIISIGALANTGSIGVYYSEVDFTQYDARNGINVIQMRSTNAQNKNRSATDENGRVDIQTQLDVIEDLMLSRIATGRGITKKQIIENYGQGLSFLSKSSVSDYRDAFKRGMIDKVTDAKLNFKKPVMTTKENNKMYNSLLDAYAEHPELEKLVIDAINQSIAIDRNNVKDANKRLANYLSSEQYPKGVSKMVAKYLNGDYSSIEIIDAAIESFDLIRAEQDVKSAEIKTENTDRTVSDENATTDKRSTDGVIRNKDDYEAEVAKMHLLRGIK